MKFYPIFFSTEMVQAILEGRKTQTRRVVKAKRKVEAHEVVHKCAENDYWIGTDNGHFTGHSSTRMKCPYGNPGDVLWVRETWCSGTDKPFHYAASVCNPKYDKPDSGWKPSIHMPKEAARLFLQIKSVRVERLNDISEEDAIAEGIGTTNGVPVGLTSHYVDYLDSRNCWTSSFNSFRSLWSSIYGTESWTANPWVWVIEFERIQKPNNFLQP